MMYFPVVVKELQECWPRDVFNSQKETNRQWVIDHQLLPSEGPNNEELIWKLIHLSNQKKDAIKSLFTQHMEKHFRLVADLSGFNVVDGAGGPQKVRDSSDFVKGIVNDTTGKNVERLCWILYYASNSAYKSIFGMELNEYYEELVMDQLKVSYKSDSQKDSVKGCVSQYINKLLNNYRSNVKDAMAKNRNCGIASVGINAPTEGVYLTTDKPKVKNTNYLFWIGRKRNMDGVATNAKDRKKLIIWNWVGKSPSRSDLV
jgi:hypothetical protein